VCCRITSLLSGPNVSHSLTLIFQDHHHQLRWTRRLQTCDEDQSVTTQEPGGFGKLCMQEYPSSQSYGCTSNDVRIAGVTIKQLRDSDGVEILGPPYECTEGEFLDVDFTAEVFNGAKSTRSDAAVFWSEGADALTGADCSYSSFTAVGQVGGAPPDENGLPDLEDPTEHDTCGDMPGQQGDFADICGLKIKCSDPTGGSTVRVASCTTYKIPGANGICSNTDPETFLPGSPSKCKCEFTEFPISVINPPGITKTCTQGTIVVDVDGVRSLQWTVTVAITNNNVVAALNSWVVTDHPLAFDDPLSSDTDGPIDAGQTLSVTRTITEALPSASDLNLGFDDTVTLSSPNGDFEAATAPASCPFVCEFTAICALGNTNAQCVLPDEETDPALVFDPIGATPCGDLVLTSSDDGADPCVSTVVRTYILFDDLDGNGALDPGEDSASCVETIDVADDTPTLTKPSDVTLECSENVCTATTCTGSATAADDCETLTPTYTDTTTMGCGFAKTIQRTWSVIDKCSHEAMDVQTITVKDTVAPVLSALSDDKFECPTCLDENGDFDAQCFQTPTVTDACSAPGEIVLTNVITKAQSLPCLEGEWTNTWTATDACDLQATTSQKITVEDTLPPVIPDCPGDDSVDLCSEVSLGPPPATLAVSDACGAPPATLSCCFDSANDRSVRTWSVTDNCGNAAAADCIQNVGITTETCTA